MKREEWEAGLKRLQAILKDAKDTQIKSLKDIEELEFTISSYEKHINSM